MQANGSAHIEDRSRRLAFLACNKNALRFGEDASYTYRCDNLAHVLRARGHTVWVGHVSRFPWWQRWDAVVFHRPRATWRVIALQAWLRQRGVCTIADVDDLVFDPAFAHHSPGVVNESVTLETTRAMYRAHQRALARFPRISVSTGPLQNHARVQFPAAQVAVLPNTVHASWRPRPSTALTSQPKVITYTPGTRSHDRDFATVAGALTRVLGRHPQVRLHITGPLQHSVKAGAGQLVHRPKMAFADFHRAFEGAAINIAPLESSPFTRCKSAIKVVEAAWWNIPTVCSPLPDAERLIGAGALPADGEAAFEAMIDRLLTDTAFYAGASTGLRERLLPLADVDRVAQDWLDFAFEGAVPQRIQAQGLEV